MRRPSPDVWELVEKLISEGWHFNLSYTDIYTAGTSDEKGMRWEADFTKRKLDTSWDNHECGISKDNPDEAIRAAYQNIKDGRKAKE